MSRANSIDFLDSSGWPLSHESVLKHLYPPHGPGRQAAYVADDPMRPLADVGLEGYGYGEVAQELSVTAIGYHTTLLLELVSLWKEFLSEQKFRFAIHVLEPGLGDAVQAGWGKEGHAANLQASFSVDRGWNPIEQDPAAFLEDFKLLFGGHSKASADDVVDGTDLRIERADVFLCTEPAFLCNVLGKTFLDRPLIGYFANPLTAYLPAAAAQGWLADFLSLTRDDLPGRHAPFLAVANTRFLAEQIRFQTGAQRILAARPLAAYMGPKRGPAAPGQVVVVRQPSMFWNAACILNTLARLNIQDLSTKGGLLKASELRFLPSEELPDASSEAIASFEAAVIYPYDVSQMRLYELYALSVPLFVPANPQLASYIYRGLTSIEDFDHKLPSAGGGAGSDPHSPHLDYNPFDRSDWRGVDAWTQLTHWVTLPHLLRFACSSVIRA
ncbi:iksA [Symbiodinium pilosum]|uniref:IksA protein n=1 Tax=Symbiodinium pilosum TaxID=2952 RepID=A0A812R035_SYMPI|nr:iksA [Symbiodinium pilosum]